ncbi:MAG: LysM peptidoglycan-binding domain-containing protein [Chloroflexi bacterium]|nr:LysM peptidoglycan-binding domain-containing protein [Chloroflexota bacterium]
MILLVSVTAVSALSYRVTRGDTLSAIAQHFGVTVNAIVQANNIANPDLIYADQVLEIPTGETPPPTPTPPPTGGTTYIVQSGDTLSAIARRFGTTITAIAQTNNIANVNYIYVGQSLTIPDGTAPPPPPETGSLELGGQTVSMAHSDRMRQAGMTWVKIQHKWTPGDDPNTLADTINNAHDKDFKILLSIAGADTYPAPGSIDFNSYVSFVGGVAALGADAIEVWNEVNIDLEWPAGEISPTSYVNNMLAPSYNAIKAANSNVMVISSALAPTGFDNDHNAWADDRYVYGMAAAGAANYADCIGVHHNAGATSPAVSFGHPGGTHYSWYFQPTMNLYYNAFGGARSVCFTELGYLSGDGFPGIPPNFAWASATTVAQQAQWLAEAVSLSVNSGKVRMMIVYNVDFTKYDINGDPQAGYAMIRPDGSCPSCDSLNAVTGGE